MSRGPSMTALLGLLAVAGYQNRDKITEWLGGLTGGAAPSPAPGGQASLPPQTQGSVPQAGRPPALESILSGLRDQNPSGFLGGAIGGLVDQFRQAGHGETAESWVASGPNKAIAPPDLERAIGPDTLSTLQQQTGLSRDEILARLSRELPAAVDQYTPDGRLPGHG